MSMIYDCNEKNIIYSLVTLQALTQDGQYSNSEYNLSGVQLTVNKSSQASNVSLS